MRGVGPIAINFTNCNMSFSNGFFLAFGGAIAFFSYPLTGQQYYAGFVALPSMSLSIKTADAKLVYCG